MLIINSIELTNHCNLKCSHCENAKSTYPKGYMSKEVFTKCLDYTGTFVNLHVHGESLLHPNILEFLLIAKLKGKKVVLNTNGLLLIRRNLFEDVINNVYQLEISLHTLDSVRIFKKALDHIKDNKLDTILVANILDYYKSEFDNWVKEVDLSKEDISKIRWFNTHKWGKDVESDRVEEKQKKCYFIAHNECVVKWDGRVSACCFDFDGYNMIGHIDCFRQLIHSPSAYKLCQTCSPCWVNLDT